MSRVWTDLRSGAEQARRLEERAAGKMNIQLDSIVAPDGSEIAFVADAAQSGPCIGPPSW